MLSWQHRGSGDKAIVCKMLTWREYYHGLGGENSVAEGRRQRGIQSFRGSPYDWSSRSISVLPLAGSNLTSRVAASQKKDALRAPAVTVVVGQW